ncbi:MAG: rod shape-determining protein MreD [Immundisolibacteraceae bacterium]|nr:rod shape-determining protein MreD [Immundisolibacteraceae bacterium]
MNNNDWLLIPVTLLLAFFTNVMALPNLLDLLGIDLLLLVIIYWCIRTPERVGVSVAWTFGLLADVAGGGILGLMALVYALTAYICLMLHQQIRMLPMFQQSLLMLVLLLAGKVVGYGLLVLCSRTPSPTFWVAAVIGALAWPLLCGLLRRWRKESVHLL